MATSSSSVALDRYVIFLDIDGVLLPVPRFQFGGGELNQDCVQRLAGLVEHLGGPDHVTIILSSTWRNSPAMIEKLDAFFAQEVPGRLPRVAGGTPNGTVLVSSVTYYADDPTEQRLVRDRVDEIYRWLHTHVDEHPEGIAGRWFAIDDMKLDVDTRMEAHFVHTATDVGITDEDIARAKTMIAALPTPEEAAECAEAAKADTALKNEEIEILQVEKQQLQQQISSMEAELEAARGKLTDMSLTNRECEAALKAQSRLLEDLSYRMAVVDFAKKHAALHSAVELAAKKSGPERKQFDERIRRFVTLLRERKEVEKQLRAEEKKQLKAAKEAAGQ